MRWRRAGRRRRVRAGRVTQPRPEGRDRLDRLQPGPRRFAPLHPAKLRQTPARVGVIRPQVRGSLLTLTTATVRSKRLKPGRYPDGDGLYLVVAKGGSRSWTLRTTVDGRQREFGLGSARKVSLKAARVAVRAKKEQIDHGVGLRGL